MPVPPNVTNANRPTHEVGGPTLAPSLAGRKTGKNKLAIPQGQLKQYLGTWAKHPGVLRALLDLILSTAGATEALSAGTETTTMQRQITVAGESKITNRTSEAKLDKLTASLIRRALDHAAETTDDALLTALGFRTVRCETKIDFIERLVPGRQIIGPKTVLEYIEAKDEDIPLTGKIDH